MKRKLIILSLCMIVGIFSMTVFTAHTQESISLATGNDAVEGKYISDLFDNKDIFVYGSGFTSGGGYAYTLQSLSGQSYVDFQAEVCNKTGRDEEIYLILAKFHDNILQDITLQGVVAKAEGDGYSTVEISWYDVRSFGEGDVLKGYVFRDMQNIEPLTDACAIDTISYAGRNGWMKEPVVSLSDTKEQMVLNGEWEFMPAYGSTKFSTSGTQDYNWGKIWVPGTWRFDWNSSMDNYTQATGDMWAEYNANGEFSNVGKSTDMVWYRRMIKIPENWGDKKIQLNFERVATAGVVYIDDVEAGDIKWPGGLVDITGISPGEHMLKLVVAAAGEKEPYPWTFIPTEDEFLSAWHSKDPNYVITKMSASHVGILDDVLLTATNKTDLLSGVFITTSVENETLTLDLEFEDVSMNQNVEVDVSIIDYTTGENVGAMRTDVDVTQGSCERTVTFNYITPKLWDYKQPNLYLCDIKVTGETVNDNLVERFGFREFKVDGKDFTLNGTPIRLRVYDYNSDFSEGVLKWDRKRLIAQIKNGANIIEFWPDNRLSRGSVDFRDHLADLADEVGIMLMMPTAQIDLVTGWGGNINGEKGVVWREALVSEWKKVRNNPSVVINVGSGNRFGNGDVLNPRRIGNYDNLVSSEKWYVEQQPIGEEVFAAIKELDPTRPAMAHHGGNAGDIHSTNIYLNFVPLQEREEWISEWSKTGTMPYSAIEYGTPLNISFGGTRSQSKGLAKIGQPLATEYANIYLGNEAYQTESESYRNAIKNSFSPEPTWDNPTGYSLCEAELNNLDSFKKIQMLFSTNTYRSWRTYGISGGMLPWDDGYLWEGIPNNWGSAPPQEGFKPGTVGVYTTGVNRIGPAVSTSKLFTSEVGKAVFPNVQETLAYIGGYPDFVSKEHHYFAGSTIVKQIVLINDSRNPQIYSAHVLDGNGGSRLYSGSLAVGEIKFINAEFTMPNLTEKTTKTMRLTAAIGGMVSEDEFDYTVYPTVSGSGKKIYVYDITGDTTEFIKENGYSAENYVDQTLTPSDILVIGRKSLGSFDYKGAADTGAKVIIFGQDEQTLKDRFGFRVHDVVARRFWPIENINSPLTAGFDGEDFRDWNGKGALAPSEKNTNVAVNEISLANGTFTSDNGYHWQNTGSVAGYIIDKPDNSNWMPLIEGEFDMNYTALMQNDNVLYCGLDLEDRGAEEPMAAIMLNRMFETDWGRKQIKPNVYFMGLNRSVLDDMGVSYTALNNSSGTSTGSGVLIIDSGCVLDDNAIRSYINNGNTVISIGRAVLGSVISNGTYNGSLTPLSGDEFAGITISDTRTRTPIDNFPQIIKAPSGGQILSNGFIAKVNGSNGGKAIIFSALPNQIDENLKYLRYSKWHMQYTISRVLSNAGVTFVGTDKLYYPGYIEKDYVGSFGIEVNSSLNTVDADDPYRFHSW